MTAGWDALVHAKGEGEWASEWPSSIPTVSLAKLRSAHGVFMQLSTDRKYTFLVLPVSQVTMCARQLLNEHHDLLSQGQSL